MSDENTLEVPFFDGQKLDFLGYFHLDADVGKKALDEFLNLTSDQRLAASEHVYAYYNDERLMDGDQGAWVDGLMPRLNSGEDIWRHVHPKSVHIQAETKEPDLAYVVVEANCDWEEEHGLMMVWEQGMHLVKVGSWDGHLNNQAAFGDPNLTDFVYVGVDKRWSTRRRE